MCGIDAWPCVHDWFWSAVALGSLAVPFVALVALVSRRRRLPLGPAMALALGFLVCAEALALNVLSWTGALNRTGILIAQGLITALPVTLLLRLPGIRRRPWRRQLLGLRPRQALLLLPFAGVYALILTSGIRYAPNNGDSMTYHLARVAHWLAEGSVGPYPAGSIRQNALMPGAEYLLLILQGVANTDRLAFTLQALCYVIVVISAPWLARLAGASRGAARLGALLVAMSPLFILQASSTQNDLVAATLAIGLVAYLLPLVSVRRPLDRTTLLWASATASAALLVKGTALLAVIPLVALIVARTSCAGAERWRRLLVTSWVGLPVAALAVFELLRRKALERSALVVPVYGFLEDWGGRGANSVRGLLHHLPAPDWFPSALRAEGQRTGWMEFVLRTPHEDTSGSPVLVAVILLALLLAAVRCRAIPRRGRVAIVLWTTAWLGFHAFFRDNEYLARLQLPLLALAPVLLAAIPVTGRRRFTAHSATATGVLVGVVAVALGVSTASRNALRPPFDPRLEPVSLDYYRNHGETMRRPQEAALLLARRVGCNRIGLFMGESGFDYPITWRAREFGAETRHLVSASEWPCIVYVEHASWGRWNLPRAPVALEPASWTVAGSGSGGPFLFLRRGWTPP